MPRPGELQSQDSQAKRDHQHRRTRKREHRNPDRDDRSAQDRHNNLPRRPIAANDQAPDHQANVALAHDLKYLEFQGCWKLTLRVRWCEDAADFHRSEAKR